MLSKTTGLKVLLVDDDEDDYVETKKLLSDIKLQAYWLDWVDNYEKGLDTMLKQEHDVYLLDYNLAQYNGLDLLREVMAEGCLTPIILFTGIGGVKVDLEATRAGAADFLVKGAVSSEILERSIRYSLKQAETLKALKESEERFSLAARGSRDGLWDWNLQTDKIYFSPRWKELLGWKEEEISSSPDEWFKRVHEDDIDRLHRAITRHLEGQTPYLEIEHRMLHRDGTERWMLTRGAALLYTRGSTHRIAGSMSDISERKWAEQIMAVEREQLDITLRSIGDGVITVDTNLNILFMNPVAERLTGYTHALAAGKPLNQIFRLLDAKTHQPLENPAHQVLEQGQIKYLEKPTLLKTRDGTELTIADSMAPIHKPGGEIVGLVIVFQDITTEQKLVEEVQKVSRLESLGVVAGGLAHDFNNYLTIISSYIALAQLEVESSSEAYTSLSEAEKISVKAAGVAKQLLTFAKGGSPIRKPIRLEEIIKDTVSSVLNGAKVSCSYQFAEDLWPAEVDVSQFNQVILNLVLNAVQAMPESGTIVISANNLVLKEKSSLPLEIGHYVRVLVQDNGIGIAPENLSKIFDPYFTTKSYGNGLGLATSYSIIRRHQGHMTVKSKVGSGTTFELYLPASDKTSYTSQTEGRVTTSKGRILLVDDEVPLLKVTHRALKRLGYEVEVVEEGGKALEKYRQAREKGQSFQVVITDLTIPKGMGGADLVKALLDYDPTARVIVSSGYSASDVMTNYLEYGFKEVLEKPYSLEKLDTIIRQLIG